MRNAFTLLSSTFICLISVTPALAQGASDEAAKSYVLPYFVVGLGITLGLVAVCRPSGRRKDVRKPE